MADEAYKLDFFNKVVDVHFSSVWCGLIGAADIERFPGQSALANATVTADFAGVAGGTPGFTLVNPSGAIAGPSTKVFSAKDISSKLITGAGLGMNGFSMGYINPQEPSGWNQYGLAAFQCQGHFGKKFTVTVIMDNESNPHGNVASQVVLWKKLKVGDQFILTGAPSPPFSLPAFTASQSSNNLFLGQLTATYVVDPVAMTVTVS